MNRYMTLVVISISYPISEAVNNVSFVFGDVSTKHGGVRLCCVTHKIQPTYQ